MARTRGGTNNKEGLKAPVNRSDNVSSRGVKRSAEEGENERTEETIQDKRRRPEENSEDENQQRKDAIEKELPEGQQESSDNSETSFMDLPDDIHMNIFSFLDLPSRLNLRVNNRLDRLCFSVKKMLKTIELDINQSSCRLKLENRAQVLSNNFTQWEKLLRRFSPITSVHSIWVNLYTEPNEQHCRVIHALFHFKARSLRMHQNIQIGNMDIPHFTLPSLLILAGNVREVYIWFNCISLTAHDLSILRKKMIESGCKMKLFKMRCGIGMKKAFLKECFGVSIEEESEPFPGTVYCSADDSLELYQVSRKRLLHVEGSFVTLVADSEITLVKKKEVVTKPKDKWKIQLNELIETDQV